MKIFKYPAALLLTIIFSPMFIIWLLIDAARQDNVTLHILKEWWT